MSSELRDLPLFICGHPKAGTSLLRAIFDSHPQLVVYPEETVFFRRYLPHAADLSPESQLALAERELIHIFQWSQENPVPSQASFPDREYSHIPYEQVRQAMHSLVCERCQHPGDILSAAVLAFGQASGLLQPETRRWVEKSPYNEYYAGQIFEWWPQARCLHILRDPRDNFASYQRKHPTWNAEFFSSNWQRSTRAGLQNRQRFGPERYWIVRYEDLTRQPEEYLPRLAEFLQIDWDPSLAAPTRAGVQWGGNSMFANRFQNISAAPVARWKENLPAQDVLVIERMAAAQMQNFDYPRPAMPDAALSDRLAARWRVLSWPIRRRVRARRTQNSPG